MILSNVWTDKEVADYLIDSKPSSYITNVIDGWAVAGKGKKCLDIGCGAGRYSIYATEKGLLVTSADKNVIMNGLSVIQAEMNSLPFKDKEFDYVLSINVMHNAISRQDFSKSVQEACRVLTQEGQLLCCIFTNDILDKDLSPGSENGMYLVNNELPMRLPSQEEMDQEMRANGLEKISVIRNHQLTAIVGKGTRNMYTALYQKTIQVNASK